MIRIICGTCGTSQGYMAEANGAIALPAAEEKRLVSRGVAEYVTRPIIGSAPVASGSENGGNDIPARALPDSAGIVAITDGHFDRESLLQLTRPQLEQLAGDMGIDFSQCKNKNDIADLLIEVEVETGGEAPPELGAEEPVV